MEDVMLASVIIPVHNADKYLAHCLDSMAEQSMDFDDYEVICVDDGSNDGSAEILKRYAFSMPNLVIISQSNKGVSAARNAALDAARGQYVFFVDADDFAEASMLSDVMDEAKKTYPDLLIYGFYEHFAGKGTDIPREMCEEVGLYGRDFSVPDIEGLITILITPNVWRIAFRRDFLNDNGLRFHEGLATSEDLAFIYESIFLASRIRLVGERLYHYRRDGGQTLTRLERGCAGLDALDAVRDTLLKKGALDESVLSHFYTVVVDTLRYSLGFAGSLAEFEMIFDEYVRRWKPFVVKNLGLADGWYKTFLDDLLGSEKAADYLWKLHERDQADIEELRRRLAESDAVAGELQKAIGEANEQRDEAFRSRDEYEASYSYRLGKKLLYVPSRIRRAMNNTKDT
ncbi:MAG: glycosyltransferase [Eggerthellaceae bacterium]|nr:glycosyltransferase [Eggerthellaceae bacterium]